MANETKYQIQQMTSSGLIDIHPVTKAEYVTTDDNHKFITSNQLKQLEELAGNGLTAINPNTYIDVQSYDGGPSQDAGRGVNLMVKYSDTAGKATKDGSNNTITTTYATKTELANKMSEISAIANGKTKTYVVSYNKNTRFNSNGDTFVLTSEYDLTIYGDDEKVSVTSLKIGDIILVVETNVPDRFVSAITESDDGIIESVSFSKMETAKVDLASYVNTLSGTATNGVITGLSKSGSTLTVSSTSLATTTSTTTSGTATTFVSNVTQAANGKITVTKTAMPTYNNYSLPTASSTTLGGIKTNYSASGKNYGVSVDSNGNAYVNVPWANTTYGVAKYNTLGLVKPAYTSTNAATLTTTAGTNTTTPTIAAKTTTAGRYYGVEADKNGYLFVNVPWVDTNTNTTYSAGSGLSLSGTQFSLSSSGITAGTYSVATYDEYGRATAGGQLIEVGTAGQTAPSASLVTGGLFFKKVN